MRAAAAVLIAAVLTLSSSVGVAQPDPAGQVQRLLDERVAAVSAGDRAAFLRTIDASADEAFRQRQIRWFDGWQEVPETSLRLTVRTEDSGDLSGGVDRYGDAPLFLPETRQTYRLGEYDPVDAVNSLYLTYVERDGRWYVAADDDLAPIGLTTAVNLWDLTPVVAEASEHFVLVTPIARQDEASESLRLLEAAWSTFDSRWPREWTGRVPVIAPGDEQQVRRLLGSSVNVANFVAFVSYKPLREPEYRISAPRMYLSPAADNRDEATAVGDLVHELTHVATASLTGRDTPVWLQEGLAEYVRLGTGAPAPAVAVSEAPADEVFRTASGDDLQRAYDQSLGLVTGLIRRHGADAPFDVYEAVRAQSDAPGTPAYTRAAALATLG